MARINIGGAESMQRLEEMLDELMHHLMAVRDLQRLIGDLGISELEAYTRHMIAEVERLLQEYGKYAQAASDYRRQLEQLMAQFEMCEAALSPSAFSGRDGSSGNISSCPPAASQAAEVDLRTVEFSAVAPKSFEPGSYSLIDVVMYEEDFRHIVDDLIAQADEPVKEKRSGLHKAAVGSRIAVSLSSPDIEIEDGTEEQTWQGGYLDFSFAVMLPEQYTKPQILFIAAVYIDGVIATRLKFTAQRAADRRQCIGALREDVLSAFISYASQDRSRVASIIQGMKKVRPDMDIFFDVESLRSGEDWEKALQTEISRRDVLYLFWSRFARESKWVENEWRYALAHKGAECIEPVPIDPPAQCPPPEELKSKHFNDKLLYIIDSDSKR